jgi:Zn-finger nucleic acid-binding protein
VYREWTPPRAACPRCHRALELVEEQHVIYRRCRCGGVFVDPLAFARMWSLIGTRRGKAPHPVPELWPRPSLYHLPCPICSNPMDRVDLMGIPLDRCERDGLWFDPPELEIALMAAAIPFHEWLRRFAGRLRTLR